VSIVGHRIIDQPPTPGAAGMVEMNMIEATGHSLTWYEYGKEHVDAFSGFCCGHDGEWTEDLNNHLPLYAIEDAGDGMSKTYVFYDASGVGVAYVTVCCTAIPNELFDKETKEPIEGSAIVPDTKWGNLPALLIGRIAVRESHQHLGYGSDIINWVKAIALDLPVGCRFVVVHVQKKNKKAQKFYKRELFFAAPHRQRALWLYDVSASSLRLRDNAMESPVEGDSIVVAD